MKKLHINYFLGILNTLGAAHMISNFIVPASSIGSI